MRKHLRSRYFNNPPKTSWGYIIICICLSIICPFLLIPYWLIHSKLNEIDDNTKIETTDNVFFTIVKYSILFIICFSPIVAIGSFIKDGISSFYNKNFIFCFVVTILDIIGALLFIVAPMIEDKKKRQ